MNIEEIDIVNINSQSAFELACLPVGLPTEIMQQIFNPLNHQVIPAAVADWLLGFNPGTLDKILDRFQTLMPEPFTYCPDPNKGFTVYHFRQDVEDFYVYYARPFHDWVRVALENDEESIYDCIDAVPHFFEDFLKATYRFETRPRLSEGL